MAMGTQAAEPSSKAAFGDPRQKAMRKPRNPAGAGQRVMTVGNGANPLNPTVE